ncbi:hypothetical protein PC116_g17957 [Phytophthora cactorum]|uniref:Uncharacterized protein n=1 Tax=Phytophthora cactorum TaxID=29920 RepID=A0A8T1C1C9_9STRA|nr:hypothetical protein Pcac1_g10457 [Phytophthora cactorum]KAG2897187.1 hypothetical protein PC114_g14781 [Phytophthora cactorum]KAG2912929.1 hypothetical protein PC117_g18744 [Phytophthora cactorum]KAG3008727.1 hypothetical protein PC120_g16054 [Phytophthora cactorum]KAG3022229.1 hypothetical protein PC119_g9366 [Phytophthora cactorum]
MRERAAIRAQPLDASTACISTTFVGSVEASTGLFFESAAVRSWYNGSGVLPALNPGGLSSGADLPSAAAVPAVVLPIELSASDTVGIVDTVSSTAL